MAKPLKQHASFCTCAECVHSALHPSVPQVGHSEPRTIGPFETVEEAIAGGVPAEFFEGEGAPVPHDIEPGLVEHPEADDEMLVVHVDDDDDVKIGPV